jgi:hypothetical protein
MFSLLLPSWTMRFLRFLRKALAAYWRVVNTPLTEEEQEEMSIFSF